MKRALLVVNPAAGAGQGEKRATQLAEELHRLDIATRIAMTEVHAADRLREAICAAEVVIAVGGDGTLNSVAHAILTSSAYQPQRPAIGFLPTGTGNVAIRAFRLPSRPRDVAALAAAGTTRTIDVGLIVRDGQVGSVFLLWAGVGIDASLIDAVARRRSRYRGRRLLAEYVCEGLKMAFHYRFPTILVTSKEAAGAFGAVAIANVGKLIFGTISRAGDPSDGHVDLIATLPRTRAGWAFVFLAYALRHYDLCPRVVRTRTREVNLSSADHVPIHADGEPVGFLPAEIHVRAASIALLSPEGAPAQARGRAEAPQHLD